MAFVYSPLTPHGHCYYETAQFAALGMYVALLLGLGCQLIFLAPGEWRGCLRGDAAVLARLAAGPRSVIGGAAASLVTVAVLRRALGFRGWAVLDAFATPLCWALVVQSVGCVLTGCCWGEPTAAGTWGMLYGPGTPAYITQQAQGLLPAGTGHTPALASTQLCQLLLCAGVGLLLHLGRRRAAGWPGGSRYLLAMGLLVLGRFLVEFWRDPASEPLLATPLVLAGISLLQVQWLATAWGVGFARWLGVAGAPRAGTAELATTRNGGRKRPVRTGCAGAVGGYQPAR